MLALAPGAAIVNLAGNALSGTGVALLQLGRPAEAVTFLLAALTIRAEIEDREQQHVNLVHLASAATAGVDAVAAVGMEEARGLTAGIGAASRSVLPSGPGES